MSDPATAPTGTTTVTATPSSVTTTTAPAPVEPGYTTTEFWLSLIVIILGALATSGLIADGSTAARLIGMAMSVLGALGYTAARAIVKKAAS